MNENLKNNLELLEKELTRLIDLWVVDKKFLNTYFPYTIEETIKILNK